MAYEVHSTQRSLKFHLYLLMNEFQQMLKKWFGQMVEALVFVHSKSMIHRYEKESHWVGLCGKFFFV